MQLGVMFDNPFKKFEFPDSYFAILVHLGHIDVARLNSEQKSPEKSLK